MKIKAFIIQSALAQLTRLTLIVLCLNATVSIQAQTYPVWVNALPPTITSATVYLGDFAHIEATGGRINFQVELRDPVEQFRQVHFRLSIIRNGTTVMMTNPSITPPLLTLQKGFPVMVNGADLAFYFDLNHLVGVSGFPIGNVLPEDYYSICIEVVDFARQEVISEKVCASGFLNQLSPPLLYFPQQGAPLSIGQSVNLMFNWQLTGISVLFNSNISYIFELREMAPGLENPQEYFENNTLIYQTEVQNNSLIYGVGLPALVKDKRYIWRVRALARDNTGQELVGYFHNNGVSEIWDFTLPDDLGKDDDFCHAIPPKPAKSQSPIAQVFVDDVIQVGHFEVLLTDVQNASGDAVRGRGSVLIPFLNIEVETTFDNLKVNEKYEAYGGQMDVVRNDTWLNALSAQANGALSFADIGFVDEGAVQQVTFLSRKINDDSPNLLPLSLKEQLLTLFNVEMPYDLIISKMQFTPQGAAFDAVMMVPDGIGGYARFGTSGIGIDDSGFDIEDLKLFLSEHTSMPAFEDDFMHIIANPGVTDSDRGSYIEFDCKGFAAFNLQGRYRFDKSLLARASNVSIPVTAHIHIETKEWGETLAAMTMHDFAIQGMNGWRFEVLNGYVDFSSRRNLANVQLPDDYVITDDQWRGFYITDVKTTLPQELKFGYTHALEMMSQDMVIDHEGVSFSGTGRNMLALGAGNAGGWGLSFEELQLNISKNAFEDARIKGQVICVPIVDTIDYRGSIFIDENTGEYALDLLPREDIDIPFLSAIIEPDAESVISIRKEPPFCVEEWRPYADFNGPLNVMLTEEMFTEFGGNDIGLKITQIKDSLNSDETFEFNLTGVELKGFKINHPKLPEGRFFGIDRVATATGGVSLAEVPLSVEGVDLLEEEFELEGKQPGLGLGFHISTDSFGLQPKLWALNESEEEAGPYEMASIELTIAKVPKKAFACECNTSPDYCQPPAPHRDASALRVGSMIQAGHFDLEIKTIAGNSGTGIVAMPFLGSELDVDFSNITIDASGMVTGGTVISSIDDVFGQHKQEFLSENKGALALRSITNDRDFLDRLLNEKRNISEGYECPIALGKYVTDLLPLQHDGQFEFVLLGIDFQPDAAYANMMAILETPDGQALKFSIGGVKLRPNGFDLEGLNLYLTEEAVIPMYHGESVRLLANDAGKPSEGSYISYDCDGFVGYTLRGLYTFDKAMLVSADNAVNPVEASLEIYGKAWNDFEAIVHIKPFMIPGQKGWRFEVLNGAADFSASRNLPGMQFPDSYLNPNAAWQGFVANAVRVTLPEDLKFGNDRVISFETEYLIIDGYGVSGSLIGNSIKGVDAEKGTTWQMSVDQAMVNFHHNQFVDAQVEGELYYSFADASIGHTGHVYKEPVSDHNPDGFYAVDFTPTHISLGKDLSLAIQSKGALVSLLKRPVLNDLGQKMLKGNKPVYAYRPSVNAASVSILNFPETIYLPSILKLNLGGTNIILNGIGITEWGTTEIEHTDFAAPGVYFGSNVIKAYRQILLTQSSGL